MAIHNFNISEQFVTIDKVPDFRSDVEKVASPLQLYDHDKVDIALAERWSEEIINLSGAWCSLFLKIPKSEVPNEVWDEDADPIYANPRTMKIFFKPEEIKYELTKWGVDIPLRITAVFSRAVLMQNIGARLVLPGDIIEAPYNNPTFAGIDTGPKRFRILNSYPTGFFLYRWLYYTAICELITGDDAVKPLARGVGGEL